MYWLKVFFFCYLLFINFVIFLVWGWDKYRAIKEKRRVSEKDLLLLTALGGGLGAMTGMSFFRHKTIKASFLWKFWLIVFVQFLVLSTVLIVY